MTISVYVNPDIDMAAALSAASALFSAPERIHAWNTITEWPEYRRTPLVDRPDLARATRVGRVLVKDESVRSHLRSFKSLGGAYAVQRAHQRWIASGEPGPFVASCVTDGNHGLSVAWGAAAIGVDCVIYVPSVVTDARVRRIEEQGATVRRIDGNYDDVTRQHALDAERQGWTVVTDTESRETTTNQSVVDVSQGYGVLARELGEDLISDGVPSHVFLQGGCGGMAGALLPDLIRAAPHATFVIVEPSRAACLQESARAGEARVVEGDLATRMVGMSVGEISRPAWKIIYPSVAGYVAVGDAHVDAAMRDLAGAPSGITSIESGETGCAGLVALLELERDEEARYALGIDETSVIALVNTEGATDPESYRRIVGVTVDSRAA
jgi:diaminopropionate ammonia-lyase